MASARKTKNQRTAPRPRTSLSGGRKGGSAEPPSPPPRSGRLRSLRARLLALALVVALAAVVGILRPWSRAAGAGPSGVGATAVPSPGGPSPSPAPPAGPFRAFTSTSYWNTPLPPDAPVDRSSDGVISFLERDNANPFVVLTGVGPGGRWGHPIYWASPSDPTFAVQNSCAFVMPPEFAVVRIPKAAHPDPGSDSDMTIYDLQRGTVYALWHAHYDAAADRWSSCGGTVYYVSSNGLDGSLPQSDQPANAGHRGLPPPVYAIRYDEIRAGHIDHVLRINVNTTACSHVFPMTGDECGTRDPAAPPEGTRIRLDPTIDLTRLHLSPAALVVAQALQRYGAVIGDQTGGSATIQVEGVVLEGRGWLWRGVLGPNALKKLPLKDFQVIREGYEG